MAAARKRRTEVQQMIREHSKWLAERWHAHNLFVVLLEHMLPKKDVLSMSFAERCKRVYACHAKDHFADLSKWETEAETFQKALGKAQASLEGLAPKVTDEQMQLVYFIKHFLPNGTFASVPDVLWRAATAPVHGGDASGIDPTELESYLLSDELPSFEKLQEHIFFQ